MERGGGEKGEEPGRPAGGACSLPEPRQPPSSLLSPRLSPTPVRAARGPAPEPGGRRGSSASVPGLASPRLRPDAELLAFGGRPLLYLARGPTGKEGESGDTHTRRARAHCTLAAARPRRGAAGASLAPRLRARHLPAPGTVPGPRPADPPAPRLRCCPFARESDNIPTTYRLWRNWSGPPRLLKAARVRLYRRNSPFHICQKTSGSILKLSDAVEVEFEDLPEIIQKELLTPVESLRNLETSRSFFSKLPL
uniref:Uncharacterized protein LOC109682984 n=1 Tax=Castor canadensis TaxID=51338 RepID=A0A8B7U3R3_CASCN|nr:uncharacterized protein LOC109682984 [Castor canadensis]